MKVWYNGELLDFDTLTKRVQKVYLKDGFVECMCGTPHSSIHIPGHGPSCRYARGFVTHKDSGLIIAAHDCHECNGYFGLSVNTPPEKQICGNCKGPAVPSGQPSCFPDVAIFTDFLNPAREYVYEEVGA